MNDHEKNSALCGHLLVAWAFGLNAVALFTCPGSFRLTHLLGVVLAALAMAVAWVSSGLAGAGEKGEKCYPAFLAGCALASAVFTLLSWLALVVGVISRG